MQGLPIILVVEDDHLIQSVVEEALKEGASRPSLLYPASMPSSCSTLRSANTARS